VNWKLILNPLSIGNISGWARGKRQEAKGGINNQFLITGFSITSDRRKGEQLRREWGYENLLRVI